MTTHTTTPSPLRDAWEAVADDFDRYATPHTTGFGAQVLERVGLAPGVRVLDVGAGSGGLSLPAARRGADVTAVDIAPTMIDRLEARARAEGLRTLRGEVGDGEQLELPDDAFDVAVSLNGVSVFPDLSAGLREMVRVTRPGGTVLVAAFGPLPKVEFVAYFLAAVRAVLPETGPPPGGPLPPFRLAEPATMQRTLAEAGLRDVRIESADWEMSFASADDFLAAVRAVLPETGPPTGGPLPPFRLSEPATMQRTLAEAGLRDVRVESADWEMSFASADDFLGTALSSNPLARQLTAGLTDEAFGQLRQVLDGMLRERSGGRPGAVLHNEMRIGWGIS